MSTDPATVGARVLANLSAGRVEAIKSQRTRGSVTEMAVRRAYDVDVLEGRAKYGRINRIARHVRRQGIKVSARQVRRILRKISRPDS